MNVLLSSVSLPAPAELPKKELLAPVELPSPALLPKKELQQPSNGAAGEAVPAVLIPAFTPKKVLKLPAATVAFAITDAPASDPPNVLLFGTEPTPLALTLPPNTLNTRAPRILN